MPGHGAGLENGSACSRMTGSQQSAKRGVDHRASHPASPATIHQCVESRLMRGIRTNPASPMGALQSASRRWEAVSPRPSPRGWQPERLRMAATSWLAVDQPAFLEWPVGELVFVRSRAARFALQTLRVCRVRTSGGSLHGETSTGSRRARIRARLAPALGGLALRGPSALSSSACHSRALTFTIVS